LKLSRKGSVECILVDEPVLEKKLVGRNSLPLGKDCGLVQGLRRMPMKGQEADLDRQRC
jgi:hypothetical protein